MRPIYLDYNATTPIAPEVREAMRPFLDEFFGNPSSSHASGRVCREAMEDARSHVASLLGADRDEIVFTSGGTESNNMAIKGVLLHEDSPASGHLVISSLEHPAVTEPAEYLRRSGFAVSVVPCDRSGMVDPRDVEAAIRSDTRLVSVMHANNEIGTVQQLREIGAVCRDHGVLFHTDAAQTVGKIRTNVEELNVDLLSVAGHKLYAPKGVGALYVRPSVDLEPLLHGAGQEGGLRAGTENVPYAVGLGAACALAATTAEAVARRLTTLRDRLLDRLREAIGDTLAVNGSRSACLPNTLSVNFPSVAGSELLARVPELCASTGAACHSTSTSLSPTLAAIQLDPAAARGAVRLSLGRYTTEQEIDRAAELLIGAWESMA
ncbi:MAG: cysteine desulfurase [Planctomycetes bacterium]|nr:cysteine desulfurase [Planctomycetota bacterium]